MNRVRFRLAAVLLIFALVHGEAPARPRGRLRADAKSVTLTSGTAGGGASGTSGETSASSATSSTNPASDAARAEFKKGIQLYEQKRFDEAAETLRELPELAGLLTLYQHWFLGRSLMELGKYKEAEPELGKIIQGQANREMKYQAQFLWGEIALRQNKYAEGSTRLAPLERKWRGSYRYPEVLYRLMVADLRLGRIASACKRARKLYGKYPAHPTVIAWGSDLSKVEIDGRKLPCKTEKDDFAARVRSLQWSGESEKVHKEIVDRLSKSHESERFDLDMTLAAFMVSEGNVDDALNLLVRYYPLQRSNLNFLLLLARAAARSGEYQTAVGAYERAYELSPRSKKGREALYQAAYMSYQFQDYDGAVRKFQQFSKANPTSGLSRDAEWNLAWLQYLRRDYKGAIERFEKVARAMSIRRRKNENLRERLLYWMAMSHIRLNQLESARHDLQQIIAKNSYSYYGLAAQARLESVNGKMAELAAQKADDAKEASAAGAGSGEGEKSAAQAGAAENPVLGAKDSPVAGLGASAMVAASPASGPANGVSDEDEEKESEEDIGKEETGVANKDGGDDDDTLQASDFKDPVLRARIDVAQKLIQLGLPDLARWELSEVEKHTRNPQYLRQLISAYEGIESYNRSATIADLSFAKERDEGGFDGAHALWASAYPQAFEDPVIKGAREFGVPAEWIWAIMRTESMYRVDVISPVGAKGLMQLMEYTARNLNRLRGGNAVKGNIDLLKPDVNIRLGSQYLARLQTKFKGQLPLVAAAYNAGPHRVEGWLVNFGYLETDEFIEHIPFVETRNYVKRVVRYNTFYRRLYSKDLKSASYMAKGLGVPIPSRAATRESWESL